MRKRLIFKRRKRFFVIRELKSVGSKLTLRQQEASVESPEVGIRQIVTAAESKINEGRADYPVPGGILIHTFHQTTESLWSSKLFWTQRSSVATEAS